MASSPVTVGSSPLPPPPSSTADQGGPSSDVSSDGHSSRNPRSQMSTTTTVYVPIASGVGRDTIDSYERNNGRLGGGSSGGASGSGSSSSSSSSSSSLSSASSAESTLPFVQSVSLAALYMLGSISYFLLIRHSKSLAARGGLIMYDDAAIVFFVELSKCVASITAMYCRTRKFLPLSIFRDGSWRIGLYYAVPSAIYAVYNNLTFAGLSAFDPGSYQVFMQTRVLFTGVLYSYLFHRTLSPRKWVALLMLTLGVAAKYITPQLQLNGAIIIVLIQASLSAMAGVYNEFLLKRDITMDVNESNFFLYAFALLFNVVIGLCRDPHYYMSGEVFITFGSSPLVLLIVINGAGVGIVTSLILKFINVIVKAFASACEVLLTALLAALFLGEKLTTQDLVACVVVMGSIYVYYT